MIINIEYCINCHQHTWCSRHDQKKYQETYQQMRSHLLENISEIEVYGNRVPNHYKQLSHPNNKNNVTKYGQMKYFDKKSNNVVVFPKMGSFQIYVEGVLIFSKIKSCHWPKANLIIQTIKLMKRAHENNQPLQKYQVKIQNDIQVENIMKQQNTTLGRAYKNVIRFRKQTGCRKNKINTSKDLNILNHTTKNLDKKIYNNQNQINIEVNNYERDMKSLNYPLSARDKSYSKGPVRKRHHINYNNVYIDHLVPKNLELDIFSRATSSKKHERLAVAYLDIRPPPKRNVKTTYIKRKNEVTDKIINTTPQKKRNIKTPRKPRQQNWYNNNNQFDYQQAENSFKLIVTHKNGQKDQTQIEIGKQSNNIQERKIDVIEEQKNEPIHNQKETKIKQQKDEYQQKYDEEYDNENKQQKSQKQIQQQQNELSKEEKQQNLYQIEDKGQQNIQYNNQEISKQHQIKQLYEQQKFKQINNEQKQNNENDYQEDFNKDNDAVEQIGNGGQQQRYQQQQHIQIAANDNKDEQIKDNKNKQEIQNNREENIQVQQTYQMKQISEQDNKEQAIISQSKRQENIQIGQQQNPNPIQKRQNSQQKNLIDAENNEHFDKINKGNIQKNVYKFDQQMNNDKVQQNFQEGNIVIHKEKSKAEKSLAYSLQNNASENIQNIQFTHNKLGVKKLSMLKSMDVSQQLIDYSIMAQKDTTEMQNSMYPPHLELSQKVQLKWGESNIQEMDESKPLQQDKIQQKYEEQEDHSSQQSPIIVNYSKVKQNHMKISMQQSYTKQLIIPINESIHNLTQNRQLQLQNLDNKIDEDNIEQNPQTNNLIQNNKQVSINENGQIIAN